MATRIGTDLQTHASANFITIKHRADHLLRNTLGHASPRNRDTIAGRHRLCRHSATVLGATVLFVASLLLASCAPGGDLPELPVAPPGPYRLGAADQVRIITFGEDRLTGQYSVDDGGNIALPLLGILRAEGLTPAELDNSIKQQLREKSILLDPSVSVEVTSYRPIFVLGEVAKPGQYPYQPGMTVLTAVAVAGGFTYRAQTGDAAVLRKIGGQSVEGRAPRGTDVRPGDVVTILERYF